MTPFYTIIVPTFKQAHFIDTCIRSLLVQTYTDFEILVSDDSDDDETEGIVTSFSDKRIRYYRNNPRLGRVQNYRTCILERARGKWCLICDGDDFISDCYYLEYVKSIIEVNPSIVFIQAGHFKGAFIETAVEEVPLIPSKTLKLTGYQYLMQYEQLRHFSHLSTVSNIEILKKIDPFRLIILSSDIDTYLRLACHGDVYLLKKPVGLWRQHHSNASSTTIISTLIGNLTWIRSVSNYWNSLSDPQIKIRIKKWEKGVAKNTIRYLFKKTVLSNDTECKDIAEFFHMAFKYGLVSYLFNNRKTYYLLLHFITKWKN